MQLKTVLTIIVATSLTGLLLYNLISKRPPTFLTTSSPDGTYTVSLKGQKTKPIFFTVEVRLDVLKEGSRILSDKLIYSADGMDFPFEYSYPNYRWIDGQGIQFYREENLRDGAPDNLIVENNTGKTIRYAQIDSIDLVLIFDMPPGFKTSVSISKSKGGLKWVSVEGEFADGTNINKFGADFNATRGAGPKTFFVNLRADKTTVEVLS